MDPNKDVQLLEDGWFFRNLLHAKSKPPPSIHRTFSDPCSSSNFPGKSYEETYESIKKISSPTTGKERRRPSRKSPLINSLGRAPSLPTKLESGGFYEDDDEEMEFSMGKLIRQASLNNSDTRRSNPKISSLKQHKSDVSKLMKHESLSLKDVEIEELQGFKDLGFDFEQDIERKNNEDKRTARLCPSEAWVAPPPPPPPPPPVPRWGGKKPNEDMKAQIKFWARAVASNVRQEC